jgi:hypothetical protein
MKIPGAEREALLEIFCPRARASESDDPVRNHREDIRETD